MEYEFVGNDYNGVWKAESNRPVKLVADKDNPNKISVRWESSYSGQFDLFYGDYKKTIIVESLF